MSFERVTRLALLISLIISLLGCAESQLPEMPLPALIQNAKAGGGWASACPPRNETERKMMDGLRLAVSPDMERRLQAEFPPGSSEDNLIQSLVTQGFKLSAPCDTDLTIHTATFFRKGRGILTYDIASTVYWKTDSQNQIVWTKGFLSYSGL